MGKVKEMSELKKRTLLAKQRLRMGYWEKQERERLEMVNGGSALDERGIEELRRAKFRRDALMIIDGDKAKKEEKMYEKVCKILDTDSDTLSPIGQLIDKELYSKMDECGRQKYILELAGKFRELSRRYYLERAAKSRTSEAKALT